MARDFPVPAHSSAISRSTVFGATFHIRAVSCVGPAATPSFARRIRVGSVESRTGAALTPVRFWTTTREVSTPVACVRQRSNTTAIRLRKSGSEYGSGPSRIVRIPTARSVTAVSPLFLTVPIDTWVLYSQKLGRPFR